MRKSEIMNGRPLWQRAGQKARPGTDYQRLADSRDYQNQTTWNGLKRFLQDLKSLVLLDNENQRKVHKEMYLEDSIVTPWAYASVCRASTGKVHTAIQL